jgi:hypothetical protein
MIPPFTNEKVVGVFVFIALQQSKSGPSSGLVPGKGEYNY